MYADLLLRASACPGILDGWCGPVLDADRPRFEMMVAWGELCAQPGGRERLTDPLVIENILLDLSPGPHGRLTERAP